jgi:hypothetical protein
MIDHAHFLSGVFHSCSHAVKVASVFERHWLQHQSVACPRQQSLEPSTTSDKNILDSDITLSASQAFSSTAR